MEKIKKILPLIAVLLISLSLKAEVITNFATLVENARRFDNKVVEIQGEIIGDIMARNGGTWVNAADGSMAVGLWLKSVDAKKLSVLGNYKHIGDIIKVKGTFYRSCKQHGGDVDIHVDTLEIVKKGYARDYKLNFEKFWTAFILVLILGVISYIYIKKYRHIKN